MQNFITGHVNPTHTYTHTHTHMYIYTCVHINTQILFNVERYSHKENFPNVSILFVTVLVTVVIALI